MGESTLTADSPVLPLESVRVVDLSRIIAGPLASQILAGLGADVIKVELPGDGDPCRAYVAQGDTRGISPLFRSLNRDKRSIVMNLKDADGLDIFSDLVSGSDVLVHNFRPGVTERLGISYQDMAPLNTRLIYCAISGFGDVGPLRTKAANDVIVQAFSGVMSFTGPVGGSPVRCGPSVADLTAGLYAAIGILTALYERTETGIGREVKTSLYEGQLNLVAHALIEYWFNGSVPEPMGTGTRVGLPNEAFPTQNGSVLIAAVDERLWRFLCVALELPEMAEDPRFVDLPARRRHQPELFNAIAERTRTMTTEQCAAVLDAVGVPCGPINRIDAVACDPQFEALGMMQEISAPGGELQRLIRLPLSFDGRRGEVRRTAPDLGADTRAILSEIGVAPELQQRLYERGVVA
jgi:crotonobetainyl-CoA:carnitine CoA-transferase CaiB-like acyl-CoA transferase